MSKILTFNGEYSFLSNFFPAKFFWHGFFWQTSENAYQAAKSLDYVDWCTIADSSISPGKAKRLGRIVHIREDWECIKYAIMLEIVTAKFEQNPQLYDKLKQTAPMILEEGNTWHDRIWGISPPGSGKGNNALGLILMQVRDVA